MTVGGLVGLRPLLGVKLHQDARRIGPWVGLITALSASSVLAYDILFADPLYRRELATSLAANPALSLVFGPARDLTTADGFNAWRAGALGGFFAALMAIFTVVRNSRADEDSGEAELVASGVTGRQSRLASALALAVLACTVLGLATWTVTVACGGGAADTAVLAAGFTSSGWLFAGVAAVTAQLGSDARAANSMAVAVLGAAFIGRGYIDSSGAPGWAAWLSPLGWIEQARPAAGNRAWALLPAVAVAAVLVGAAFALQARRDFGRGLIAPPPGPARGTGVTTPWGLAVRLNRAALVSWLGGFAVMGMVFGFLTTSVGEVIATNPAMARILAANGAVQGRLVYAFLVTILSLVGTIAAVVGVQIVMRVHAEELDFRVEPLLATALGRGRYFASNVALALVAPAAALLVAGTVLGLVASGGGAGLTFGHIVSQATVMIVPVWTLIAVATAAVGARPALRLVGWMGIVSAFALTVLGPSFRAPGWALGFSPFRHVPIIAASHPDWSGLLWVGAVAVALTAMGFAGFARRDIA